MKAKKNIYNIKWVALILSAILFIACRSDKDKLSSIDDDKSIPTLQIDSLNVNYSESGYRRMNVLAPLLERFMLVDEPFTEFKKGIHIYFYTPTQELESEIIADYAFNKEKPEEYWKAAGNVMVTNYTKQQTLYTDTLYWNRAQKIIYTDAPVRIVTPDSEIKGMFGMTANEQFTEYEIRNVNESHVYVNNDPEPVADSTELFVEPASTEPLRAAPASTSSTTTRSSPSTLQTIQQKPQQDSTKGVRFRERMKINEATKIESR